MTSHLRCPSRWITRAALIVWLMIACSANAAAQAGPPPRTSADQQAVETALAELRKLVMDQRALIDGQSQRIEALEKALSGVQQRVQDTTMVAESAQKEVVALKQASPSAQRLEKIEEEVQRIPSMPTDAVTAGEFPGSMRIPGTNTALKIGGQVRLTAVETLAPLGTDDRFVTSSIPVEAQEPGEDARTVYTPVPSRFNFDLRGPFRGGSVRTFIEGDFAGSGNVLRLRHAYIQTDRWLLGQSWSTFADPEAEPIGIDFEGLNAISLFRQPQIRYTRQLRKQLRLALAVENPAPDLTGAQGVNLTPDFIARVRWRPAEGGPLGLGTEHIQVALLVRTLRGELDSRPEVTLSTGGFGGTVSGVLAPRWDTDDRIKFAGYAGWGIGKYITDLGTLGGQDAVFDPVSDSLRALQVSSGYVGYERAWTPTFLSAFTYGIVNVDNLDIQPLDALKRTQRTSMNITWSPVPQADIVLEFLFGTRVNKDGRQGTSSQIQAGWTYRF
jgi:hypothetical protein